MKNILSCLGSFQARVTLILVISMLFVGMMSNFVIHKFAVDFQFSQLRQNLKTIAQIAASVIDGDAIEMIPLDPSAVNLPSYQMIAEKLREIKKRNPAIYFIYIMTTTDTEGIWQFVVDPDPLAKRKSGITAYPGDRYDASRFPEMLESLQGATADKKIGVDEWGVTLSGYAPIFNENGKAVAVLGVDMLASDVYLAQRSVHLRALFVLLLGIMLSIILGMLFSRKITGPIKELVRGTRRISQGDLAYKVRARGVDEIRELADSFNNMADDLNELQRKNHDYFYNVIQSLVRIVEAKDSYTRGHSERVAGYAAEIASRMGFSKEKVELIEEAGMLHDIGKLGIQDSILNKKERLTDAEWEVIRQHPIVGEDILKPVSLNSEMLAIVRAHHERYDGSGYPDKLRGDEINVFAQVLSVADSYDAMTSARAYRAPLDQNIAINELKKNRGIQFNPEIVDTFIEVLKEGKA